MDKNFYRNISCCVINNGYTSNYFKLERGVRQGCPLSPYLFIINVELLAESIRKEDKIKSLLLAKKECKLSMYADDTSLLLKPEEEELNIAIEYFTKFTSTSELKMNIEKN